MKEHLEFDFSDQVTIAHISKALSSPVRLQILALISERPLNISEIAQRFSIPISSAAMHMNILEEAGIVITQSLPGVRGSQKVCGLKIGKVAFSLLNPSFAVNGNSIMIDQMPIGNYFDFKVSAPCGIVSDAAFLSSEDHPYGFYSPEKHTAQLLWLTHGYLEYRFSNYRIKKLQTIKTLEFSMELCSEAPGYNNTWKSDIFFEVNAIPAGMYTSEGDFGGRPGKLNPEWWDKNMTQYGTLVKLTIDHSGTYINESLVSDYTLDHYRPCSGDCISLKLGVHKDARYVGGMNLFGEGFGDHRQNIEMKIVY